MNKRIASIDLLRGIAIIGMILSANIGYQSGLPAWMFHAQTPPPTYAFNPDIPGITWVDLVFPFFLFSMGAAFPFAMRKKLDNGMSKWKVAGSLVKRWAILTLFAILLGNAYSIWGTSQPAWQIYLFQITVWAGLFLTLVRIKPGDGEAFISRHRGTAVNIAGIAILAMCAMVFTKHFGLELNRYASDIIIMILAVVALLGGLIWMFTKDSLRLRWLVIAFCAMLKALDSYLPEALEFIPSCGCISWFFSYDFLQYLLIALPGSIVGDMIMSNAKEQNKVETGRNQTIAGWLAIAAVLLQLWGLFSRNVLGDFIISAVMAGGFIALTWKDKSISTRVGIIGFILMLIGIALDPIDGGITKDHCNLSYLSTTCGMAALATSWLLMLELGFNVRGKFLAGVGQNPMIAYTITNFIIGPVLNLLGLLPLLYSIAEGSQFWGVMQGVIITLLMMCGTYAFTKLKLFWRS